jgi:hypothetical protein
MQPPWYRLMGKQTSGACDTARKSRRPQT